MQNRNEKLIIITTTTKSSKGVVQKMLGILLPILERANHREITPRMFRLLGVCTHIRLFCSFSFIVATKKIIPQLL